MKRKGREKAAEKDI